MFSCPSAQTHIHSRKLGPVLRHVPTTDLDQGLLCVCFLVLRAIWCFSSFCLFHLVFFVARGTLFLWDWSGGRMSAVLEGSQHVFGV